MTDADTTGTMAAAFAALSDGIMVFDSAHRLVAWNDRPFEYLDLPRDLARTGTHFLDILAFQAARGEFSPHGAEAVRAAALPGALAEPANFSRATAGGRIVEFRRNPMPGGGFVILVTDVTERADAARRAAAEARRLTEAMAAFGEGFALLDAEEGLVAWNARYAELYSPIGGVLREGVKFETLVRAMASSGASKVAPERMRRMSPTASTASVTRDRPPTYSAPTALGCGWSTGACRTAAR
jgi:PAS domain-containing protein